MRPSTSRRIFGAFLAILLVIGTAAIASPADEVEFLTLLNQARSAQGLAPLVVDNDLVAGARAHTSMMAAKGEIFHSTTAELGSVSTGWQVLGENVGVGPNPSVLDAAFMNSPSHRANILGDFNYIGIGAERTPDGKLFVTFTFMKKAVATTTTTTAPPTTTAAAPPLAAPPTTKPTPPESTHAPTPPASTTTAAPAPSPTPVVAPLSEDPTVAAPVYGEWLNDLLDHAGACAYGRRLHHICIQ